MMMFDKLQMLSPFARATTYQERAVRAVQLIEEASHLPNFDDDEPDPRYLEVFVLTNKARRIANRWSSPAQRIERERDLHAIECRATIGWSERILQPPSDRPSLRNMGLPQNVAATLLARLADDALCVEDDENAAAILNVRLSLGEAEIDRFARAIALKATTLDFADTRALSQSLRQFTEHTSPLGDACRRIRTAISSDVLIASA